MAVKFIPIKCPECDADLDIEEGRKVMFCSYCGRKIMMVDENEHRYTVTHRYIDDAKIREIEKKSELKNERNKINKEKFDKIVELVEMTFLILLAIAFMVFVYFATH